MRGTRTRRATLGLLSCAVASAAVLSVPAVAEESPQSSAAFVRVDRIDARGDTWRIIGSASEEPSIEIDGKAVQASVQRGSATDVVIVIDNDQSLGNGTLQLAKDAAATILPGEHGIERVAVVSTARQGAAQEVAWTGSAEEVRSGIEGIQQTGDDATWDALVRAAALLDSSETQSRRVVAFLSAPDKLSTASATGVEREMRLSESEMFAYVLPLGVDTSALGQLVSQLGGSLGLLGSDEEVITSAQQFLADLDGQFVAEIPAPEGATQQIEVTAGGVSTTVEAHAGDLQVGSLELQPSQGSQSALSSWLSAPGVQWLALLLLLAGAGGATWALLSLVVPDQDSLRSRLSVYEETEPEPEAEAAHQGMTTVPFLQRAVAFTSDVAEKRGVLESIEVSLERANLPLRAAEAMFFVGVASLLLGALTLVLTRNLFLALIVVVLAIVVPKVLLGARVRSRQKKFVSLLPDMLSLLAGTLRAGYSISQGFEAVSREIDEPMGRELRRVVTENRLGRSLEDALDATAERMGSDDFEWTVMAIKIQREVGGNLAELLLTVANTMVERERLRREVATLTAEGRISAIILGMLPPALAGVMFVMNPDYIKALFTPGLGYMMVILAVVAMVIGFAWMKKIITIEA